MICIKLADFVTTKIAKYVLTLACCSGQKCQIAIVNNGPALQENQRCFLTILAFREICMLPNRRDDQTYSEGFCLIMMQLMHSVMLVVMHVIDARNPISCPR